MSVPVPERIRRLLLLVPAAARAEDGIPVDELAERLGVSPDEVLAEIDFLLLVGKPPFSPADFLDVYVDGDRVHVALAQSLTRPPRLTHDEALALAVGAQSLLGGETGDWGAALRGVLAKLEAALTPAERERYRALEGRIVLGGDPTAEGDVHAVLRRAVEARQRVAMTYYSAHSGAFGERTVEPYGILAHRGYWYLVAGPDGAEGPKLYRFDRVREARLVGAAGAYEAPASLDLDRLRRTRFLQRAGEATVRLRVGPARARWVRERFEDAQVTDAAGGAVEVRLDAPSWEWVEGLVLALGADGEVLAPSALRARVAETARRRLAAYA